MGVARIKLVGTNPKDVDTIVSQIKSITQSLTGKFSGPIMLPTRRIRHSTRKNPTSDGSHTFERWEFRSHKRLVIVDGDDRVLKGIMRVPAPDTVQIEIVLG